jgi:hypothetical protein
LTSINVSQNDSKLLRVNGLELFRRGAARTTSGDWLTALQPIPLDFGPKEGKNTWHYHLVFDY